MALRTTLAVAVYILPTPVSVFPDNSDTKRRFLLWTAENPTVARDDWFVDRCRTVLLLDQSRSRTVARIPNKYPEAGRCFSNTRCSLSQLNPAHFESPDNIHPA